MRRQALVVSISFAAVALSCLVHEAAAQPQQGIQAGQTQPGTQQVQPEGGMMGGWGHDGWGHDRRGHDG
jgi:hypothetical protein